MLKDVFEKYSKNNFFLVAVCYKKEDAEKLLAENEKRIMKEHHEIWYVFEKK